VVFVTYLLSDNLQRREQFFDRLTGLILFGLSKESQVVVAGPRAEQKKFKEFKESRQAGR